MMSADRHPDRADWYLWEPCEPCGGFGAFVAAMEGPPEIDGCETCQGAGGREVWLRQEWVCQAGRPWCAPRNPHPEVSAPHHRCGWFFVEWVPGEG
jgi:hypothetical protein